MKNQFLFIRKANYYETDQMGIIHHSNYIRWFEEARVDFLDQIGFSYKKATEHGIDFAVLSVECQYKSMVKYGDTVAIETKIAEVSKTRIKLEYIIRDHMTQELRAIGSSSHCWYDNAKQKPVSLEKAIPELYHLFLSHHNE
ncbi:MAG: thioesterase family protein [Candidatus Izemoplasmatales bacterium]|nr:thioesterase family protein [Candidatus Izemoplasmatales bacterium]